MLAQAAVAAGADLREGVSFIEPLIEDERHFTFLLRAPLLFCG
jgi:hypothetical protein